MARNFRRHRSAHPIADLNVTNLIDLGFILLVIFMIATPLIQQEQTVPVKLPTVAKSPQTKADPNNRFVAIVINAKGIYVGQSQVPVTLTELRNRLRAFALEAKPPVIRVKADENLPYKYFVEVMNEVQRAGLTQFNIDSQAEK